MRSKFILSSLPSSASRAQLAQQEGGHVQGKSPDQLTLWGDSGPQVLSQKTAAPHHTERYRGAAGSGPGEETRGSHRKERSVRRAVSQRLPNLGRQQNHGAGGGLLRRRLLGATPTRFSHLNLGWGLRLCISSKFPRTARARTVYTCGYTMTLQA